MDAASRVEKTDRRDLPGIMDAVTAHVAMGRLFATLSGCVQRLVHGLATVVRQLSKSVSPKRKLNIYECLVMI